MGARVGGLRARLVWESAARGAFAACAVERRALCAAGQRGGGVGAQRAAHKYRSPAGGLFGNASLGLHTHYTLALLWPHDPNHH